jgi:hypothetical protein
MAFALRVWSHRVCSPAVHLDCFDADTNMVPCAEDLEHARACLAVGHPR